MNRSALLLLFAAALVLSPDAHADGYNYLTLFDSSIVPKDVSRNGIYVVADQGDQAVLLTKGANEVSVQTIAPGAPTAALAVNNYGEVVTLQEHKVLFRNRAGQLIEFETDSGCVPRADLNNVGQLVFSSGKELFFYDGSAASKIYTSPQQCIDTVNLNDSGEAVFDSAYYSPETGVVSISVGGLIRDLNSNGVMLADFHYRWYDVIFVKTLNVGPMNLPTPAFYAAFGRGLNDSGKIVGLISAHFFPYDGGRTIGPFVTANGRLVRLNCTLPNSGQIEIWDALGVADDGSIAARATDTSSDKTGVIFLSPNGRPISDNYCVASADDALENNCSRRYRKLSPGFFADQQTDVPGESVSCRFKIKLKDQRRRGIRGAAAILFEDGVPVAAALTSRDGQARISRKIDPSKTYELIAPYNHPLFHNVVTRIADN